MTAHLELDHAPRLLGARLEQLRQRIEAGDESAWNEYPTVAVALARVSALVAPGARGELLTTAQLAAKLQISTRTVRRKVKAGALQPIRLGQRGRAALRWSAP